MPRKVLVYSPHLGGHTLEPHVAMQDCVIANLEAFFAGQPLPCGSGRVKGWFRAEIGENGTECTGRDLMLGKSEKTR
jgi:hypothetical protein